MTVRTNEGRIDRGLRVLLAAGAVAGSGVVGWTTAGGVVLLVVAAVMLGTAATGFCPLYRLLGITTVGRGDTGKDSQEEQPLRPAA